MSGSTRVSVAAALVAALTSLNSAAMGAERASPAVIELFTSQGCSSCPPADRILAELATRSDIIALTFPVTYWDYLGWKDTFAKPQYSVRQRAYAVSRGDGEVYTPQAIVNGSAGCIGSQLSAIEAALKSTQRAIANESVAIKVRREGQRVTIETGPAAAHATHKSGTIYVASLIPSRDVSIRRGENAGEQVTYTNVVRTLTEAGKWEGAATAYSVSLPATAAEQGDKLVVFLQTDNLGPILAAARVEG